MTESDQKRKSYTGTWLYGEDADLFLFIIFSADTTQLEPPPVVKTPEPKIWKIFQKNKNLGAKRSKIWAFSGREVS